MNRINRIAILGLLAVVAVFAQQNSLVQTSLSAAITPNQTSFAVASATGINAPSLTSGLAGSKLYIVDPGQTLGESVQVISLSSTTVTVRRGQDGTRALSHPASSMVLVATVPSWFATVDPQGQCSTTAGSVAGDKWGPYIDVVLNMTTGRMWKCSAQTNTWVPHWGNFSAAPQLLSGTATASVAGATAVAGPLVEISGTNAITSFTMSTGWNGQGFCVVPTGAFTTSAGNNIGKASTATASLALCYTYDARAAKFYPSY